MTGPAGEGFPLRVRIVDNPRSFRGPYPVARIRPILAAAGWNVDVVHRRHGVPARHIVEEALAAGCGLLVAAGGDGTLRDFVSAAGGTDLALGLLPGGTANVFAHEVGVPTLPEEAARALVAGRERLVDVGRIDLPDGRWARFLLMAGFGLDAAILAGTKAGLKRRFGAGAIALAALAAIPRTRGVEVRLVIDGHEAWAGRAWQLMVSNSRLYANVLRPNPAASLDDGLLDVCVLPIARPDRLARSGLAMVWPGVAPGGAAFWSRGREVRLEWSRPMPGQLDGTPLPPLGGAGLRLRAEARAVRLRLPA